MKNILLTNHYSKGLYDIIKGELPEGFNLITLEHVDQACLESKVYGKAFFQAQSLMQISGGPFLEKLIL